MTDRLAAIIAAIDAANEDDPRRVMLDGVKIPNELVYAERMSARLAAMYPDAPDVLKIAAHGQHLRRFDIARKDYEEGRVGYNSWRVACRDHHAVKLAELMGEHGYSDEDIAIVQQLVRKEQLKKDRLSQALENVVDVVFVEHYLAGFAQKYSQYGEEKLIDIVAKTLRKMSPKGHAAALALDLPDAHRTLIEKAIERDKAILEKLAKTVDDW